MRTLSGCSLRTGRSNPGAVDAPRTTAMAVGRWAKRSKENNQLNAWQIKIELHCVTIALNPSPASFQHKIQDKVMQYVA